MKRYIYEFGIYLIRIKFVIRNKYFLSIIASVFCTFAFSQPKHEIGLQTDNDSYLAGGSDRYYTNGISLYYQKALNTKLEKKSDVTKIIFGIELTQKMYNPKSGYVQSPKDIDRPFAGYTYIATHLNLLYKNETNISLSVQLGSIGKNSGTEAVQNFIHRVLNMYEPFGWQYQINNQFIFNVSAEYNKLLFRKSFLDLIFNSIVILGNGNIGADIGSTIRIGKFNSLFNSMATKSLIQNRFLLYRNILF